MKFALAIFLLVALTFGEEPGKDEGDKKSLAAINKRLTELSGQVVEQKVKNEELQKQVADLKTENTAERKEIEHLKIENNAMRKSDAILRDADAKLRVADARLRDLDVEILKNTKKENDKLRHDNEAKRQADPKRQDDVEGAVKEMIQSEIRKFLAVNDDVGTLKNLTESVHRIQDYLGLTIGGEVLVLKHDINKASPFHENGWNEYKLGFGRPEDKNYWFGLERIHQLTSYGNWMLKVQVRYDLLNSGKPDPKAGTIGEAQWGSFSVAGESSNYRLTIGKKISGSNFAADPFHSHEHNGMAFTTKDRDNDKWTSSNCAESSGRGGWWYNVCHHICLTCSKPGGSIIFMGGSKGAIWPSEASMWLIKQS